MKPVRRHSGKTRCVEKGRHMRTAITGRIQAGPTAPLVLRGPYEEIIPAAARLGYDDIELHIHDSARLDREALKKLLDANRIGLSSIGTGSAYSEDRIFLSSDDPAVRARAIARIEDHIHTAREYGAVVIIGLIRGLIRDCSSPEAYRANLSGSLRRLLDTAEREGATLVFEVINRYESDFLNTIAEGLDFIAPFGSERLLLHIDTYHMNIEEGNIGDSIRRAAGKIGHCHIADSDRWYAGHGHYDFGETIRALVDIGYAGALAVESLMLPDPETSARESLKTLKRLL